jgi:hypothetical protein
LPIPLFASFSFTHSSFGYGVSASHLTVFFGNFKIFEYCGVLLRVFYRGCLIVVFCEKLKNTLYKTPLIKHHNTKKFQNFQKKCEM